MQQFSDYLWSRGYARGEGEYSIEFNELLKTMEDRVGEIKSNEDFKRAFRKNEEDGQKFCIKHSESERFNDWMASEERSKLGL